MSNLLKIAVVGLGIVAAGSAFADGAPYADQEAVVYPYASSQNHCPEGLQPVTVTGVISCGRPTADVPSYQHVKLHSGLRHSTRAANCPAGEKGCR